MESNASKYIRSYTSTTESGLPTFYSKRSSQNTYFLNMRELNPKLCILTSMFQFSTEESFARVFRFLVLFGYLKTVNTVHFHFISFISTSNPCHPTTNNTTEVDFTFFSFSNSLSNSSISWLTSLPLTDTYTSRTQVNNHILPLTHLSLFIVLAQWRFHATAGHVHSR